MEFRHTPSYSPDFVLDSLYGEDEVYYFAMNDSNGFGYDMSVAHINVLDLHHKDLK